VARFFLFVDRSLAGVDALNAARKAGVIIVRSSRVGSGIIARNGEQRDDK
jgi:L-asparaginase/Glu-tRNA(Gln) amidotransferase subunit D